MRNRFPRFFHTIVLVQNIVQVPGLPEVTQGHILLTKLQSFQYKLNLRILYTNSMLMKCGLSETELCSYCFETKESLIHVLNILLKGS
jgi:hypothetical protein